MQRFPFPRPRPALFGLLAMGCGASDPADGSSGGPTGSGSDPGEYSIEDADSAVGGTAEEHPAFVLDEGTMTLHPGQEGLFCRQMPVPEAHRGSFITAVDAEVSLGTHHIIVTFSDDDVSMQPPLCKDTGSDQVATADASFQDFSVDPNPLSVIETVERIAFGGGGGSALVRFPEGYGMPMPQGFFESSHHVLNLGLDPIEIFARFEVYTAEADDIRFPVGVLFANAFNILVPPLSDGFVEGTVTAPEAMDLVVLASHAHNWLRSFEMFLHRNGTTADEPVYVSEDWETPSVQAYDPPLRLEAGDGITFRCTYRNDRAAPLRWGITDGEMCMPFAMYAYPPGTPRRVPPTISALTTGSHPVELEVGTSGFFGG